MALTEGFCLEAPFLVQELELSSETENYGKMADVKH